MECTSHLGLNPWFLTFQVFSAFCELSPYHPYCVPGSNLSFALRLHSGLAAMLANNLVFLWLSWF